MHDGDAVKLQRVAWDQLAAEGMPLTTIPCLHANPNAPGAGAGSQSALVCGRGRGRKRLVRSSEDKRLIEKR